MANIFAKTKTLASEWKQALDNKCADMRRRLIVIGDVDFSNQNLLQLGFASPEEGWIAKVRGNYYCHNNPLTTLKGGPEVVTGVFYCTGTKLTNLEGAPRKFKKLVSDFGIFKSWKDIPKHLREPAAAKEPKPDGPAGLNL